MHPAWLCVASRCESMLVQKKYIYANLGPSRKNKVSRAEKAPNHLIKIVENHVDRILLYIDVDVKGVPLQ